jgi:hypothetical protein
MEKTKITAVACENDETLPVINLKCTDNYIDILKFVRTFGIIGRCPDPEECEKEMHDRSKNGEHIDVKVIGNSKG